jgi:hypothetical protein
MQNMEKYFGFEVSVLDELDPVRVEVLKDRAEKIIAQHDFNPDEYFVYFHHVALRRTKEEHFGLNGGVVTRLKKLELTFGVNPKQQRKKTIKIFNFLLDEESPSAIKWDGDVESVTYHIGGDYLAEHLGFRNELITFISKRVKKRHRKLKISVVAHPTDEFSRHIFKKTDQYLTQIDYPFRAPVILRAPRYRNIPLVSQNNHKGDSFMGDQINFNGPTQAAAVGSQATATGTTNQQVNSLDIRALQEQLAQLQSVLESRVSTRQQKEELAAIAQAQIAASKGDKDGVMSHLRNAGKWALTTAKEVGVGLVVEVLKNVIQ